MNIMWNIKHLYRAVRPEIGVLVFLVSCLVLIFVLSREKRKLGAEISKVDYVVILCFAFSITAILGSTLLNRVVGEEFEVMLIPFWSYWKFIVLGDIALGMQILFNVLIFVPFGFLTPFMLSGTRYIRGIIGSATVFSAVIEVVQLLFMCGTCEFDDVFSNVLGAILGYALWKVGNLFAKKSKKKY